MLINEKINKIKEDFSFFDNWEDKYQYLIDLGKKLPDLEDIYKLRSIAFKDVHQIYGWYLKLMMEKLTFLDQVTL